MYIPRLAESNTLDLLGQYPVVAIIGPRQCGKSTLAKHILNSLDEKIYLDLELPSDLRKLNDPEQFLSLNAESLICIDEIQRKPELFPVLRALCDRNGLPGRYLILGSASPDLLRQSSESLAGRISYLYLTPFHIQEIAYSNFRRHWLRGGFPGSWLPENEVHSLRWRNDFITTYLEKDVPALGFSANSQTIRYLWMMLAHATGQVTNRAKYSESLGISAPTVKSYIEILEKTFMVRILRPYQVNVKKRLIKTPKIYIRDTGILHSLLDIDSSNSLMGHPVFGQSWESYALEQIVSCLPRWQPFYYRTSDGAEIDLLLTRGQRMVAVECKASTSPTVGAGFFHCVDDLKIEETYIASPIEKSEVYPYNRNVKVASIDKIIEALK
jgi:uncharacterized protein